MYWQAYAVNYDRKIPASPDDEFETTGVSPDLIFVLQVTPELAETIAAYDRVCFVDAHTGSVPEDLHKSVVKPEYQSSPFTHHMTPATCLSFVKTIYQRERWKGVLSRCTGMNSVFRTSFLRLPPGLLTWQSKKFIDG